jgi:L-alanine-DL-glutamate epimerase-like enolase superfamily enzyme
LLIGEDPVNIDKLRYKLLSSIIERVDRRSLGDAIIEALSGIDIALWDIKGKVLGRPIYDLLGGIMKDKVRMYASAGLHEDPEEIAREAKKIRQEGFTAYKMRIHGEFARDLERVRTAYESLGDNTSLMIDVGTALHSWKAEHTIRFSKEVEKFNVFWLEDPVPRFDYNGLEKVRKFVNIPIAMGEQYLLMEDFKEMVVKYLIDYAQPDVVRCGGVSECKKIAAFADAWGIKYVPHSWESAIAQIANLHVVASSPNGIMIEYAKIYNPLLTEITKGKLKIENGYLCVPTSPGLGIELDEKALNRFLISSSE